jgi:vacuolar protein sorting-associated protein 13A/C
MNKSTAIKDIPKFTLDFFFEKIALELQENQFREMLGLLESFGLYQRSMQHRAYRPSVLPTQDARAWWAFAGTFKGLHIITSHHK